MYVTCREEILFHGLLLEHSDDFPDQPLDVNGPAIQFHLIRFKLGEIQNVIDQVQQRVARKVDRSEIFLLFPRFDIRPLQQFAEADDRIQRRPEFMAYRCQEIALGPGPPRGPAPMPAAVFPAVRPVR